MKKITLTKEQERLLRQEAENDAVQEDGSIAHTTFERNEREMEILQGLMNDMDRFLEERGEAAEKELADLNKTESSMQTLSEAFAEQNTNGHISDKTARDLLSGSFGSAVKQNEDGSFALDQSKVADQLKSSIKSTVAALNERKEAAKTDDSWDKAVDTRQVELAKKESCVLGSRLAIWMLKEADVKIYLLASDDLRASRILNREGGDLQEIKRFTTMRDSEDTKRYQNLYGINNNDYADVANLVIDTSVNVPEEIVGNILSELAKRGLVEEC